MCFPNVPFLITSVIDPESTWAFLKGRFQTVGAGEGGEGGRGFRGVTETFQWLAEATCKSSISAQKVKVCVMFSLHRNWKGIPRPL